MSEGNCLKGRMHASTSLRPTAMPTRGHDSVFGGRESSERFDRCRREAAEEGSIFVPDELDIEIP